MVLWKLPPKAKLYEALTAVADNRVSIIGDSTAEVISSSGAKKYTVEWSDDQTQFTSNDNASYWQGYLGYPIVAVLMQIGRLKFDHAVAKHLAGVPWKTINKQHKNDYNNAIEEVMKTLSKKGVEVNTIHAEVEKLYQQLDGTMLGKLSKRTRPPKGE